MHTTRIGLVLGFFLLTLLDLNNFAHGKAFPEDDYEGEYKYLYTQKLKPQFQPIYRKQKLPPKLYYTPHINGQPIFVPAVGRSVSHASKLLDDHYERKKLYTQSWTFTTPVTYDYDDSNQREFYEDSVTSNSIVKNLLDDTYQGGVHRGDYHILSVTPENYSPVSTYSLHKNFKVKNKNDKQNLRKKDKKRKNNRDFHGISKDPMSVKYETETVVSDYSPEVEVTGKKLPGDHDLDEVVVGMELHDYDYAPEEVNDKKLPDDFTEEDIDTKLPDHDYAPEEVDGKELSDDYSPEVVEVISKNYFNAHEKVEIDKKLSSDYSPEEAEIVGLKHSAGDHPLEVVKVVGSKHSYDDYSPEVVKVVGSKHSNDYSPEVVKVVGSKHSDDYSPEVVKVVGSKHSGDYSPEVVKAIGTKFTEEKPKGEVGQFSDYGPEIVEVVNNNNKYMTEQIYQPKRKFVVKNTDDKDSDEVISNEPFTSKEDKTKVKIDKKRIKKENSGSKVEANVYKLVKKSDKLIYKNKSQFVKSKTHDTNGHLLSVKKKPVSTPITMNSDMLQDYKKPEFYEKPDDYFKDSSSKIKPTIKSASKKEYTTDKTHKVVKEKDMVTDSSESPLDEYEKTSSTHESYTDLPQDISTEKSKEFHSRELLLEEILNSDESSDEFNAESPGSGDIANEDIRSSSLFHNTDLLRSLSNLNSNIWSLIFNPNAEFKKVKTCVTRRNESGFCMYVQQCDIPNVVTSLEQLLNDACVIDDIFIGICCPEFPVQTVKVHWEQMPSDSDKRTEAEFSHRSEDCGIRSNAASKAQSWPWKAPLVSMSNGRIFCDGVLIRDNYVLTAAHCTTKIPKNQILVRLGQHDDSSGEDFAVVEIKRHAQYNRRSLRNDIALLKLGRRIVHDQHTNVVCMPDEESDDDDDDEDDHAGEKAILLGSRGSFSVTSKKDEYLEVMTNKECEKKLGRKVPFTMLCTEARDENERTCNTDSGAPLVIKDDNKYEVIGILSWNRNDCDPRFPSIFSRVSRYVRWIKKHTV